MRAGHTFTRGFQKPFDEVFMKSMQDTMKYLCENIEGAVLGYQQSDEITIILQDYKNPETQPWFNYRTDKLCSISASMATLAFNKVFENNVMDWYYGTMIILPKYEARKEIYLKAYEEGAMFDARCFNIPKEEVTNLIYWRQLDAIRNSIQMTGQAHFSHKELQNCSCEVIQDMLYEQQGINWNDFPTPQKRGICCVKEEYQSPEVDIKDGPCIRSRWVIDKNIPLFKGENRNYIEQRIQF